MRFRSGKVGQTDVKVTTKMADKERKRRNGGKGKLCMQLAIVLCCCVVNCVAFQQESGNSNNVDTLFDDNMVVPKSTAPVKKLWGLPDITATVGRLFRFHIPSDSFSGNVHHYELSEVDGPRLPSWLQFTDSTSSLQGIPLENDRGRHFISVKAVAPPTDNGEKQFAQETFSIEVLPYWQDSGRMMAASDVIECEAGQPPTIMSLVVDADPTALGPNQRIELVQKVARQIGIDEKLLQMISFGLEEHTFDNFAIMAGPGNSRQKKTSGLLIRWQVGCSGKITDDHSDGVSTVERSSRDGTMAKQLGFPIIGWHVTAKDPKRLRRDVGLRIHHTPVMGNVLPTKPPESTHLYEEYEDIDSTSEENEEFPLSRFIPSMSSPTFTHLSTLSTITTTTHKHRHHHQVHEGSARGRHHSGEHPDDYEGLVTATPSWKYHETPMPTPVLPVTPTMTDEVQVVVDTTTVTPETTMAPTEPPVDPRTTVTVHKNFHPVLINRIQKLAITAGKVFHFQIPSDTFFDFEDGETRKLTLTLLSDNSSALPPDSWIQFNQRKQEIYALPLEKVIGHWEFQLVAVDSDGETAKEVVEIHVRQDQAFRNFNHEFTMHVKYDTHRFANVTWQIKLVEKLNEFFGDQTNLSILVRSVTPGHPTLFTWTANSLSVHYCPRQNITDLHKMMTTGKEENASLFFRDAGHPEYRVTKVQLKLLGMCKRKEVHTPHVNEAPKVRNQIDRIDAYVGRMLTFQVPEDTFSDDEGTTGRLKLLLETMDGVPLTHTSWIMFNSYNNTHEFVGLPMDSDAGEREYKLIAMDKEGLRAMDALTIVVNKRNLTVVPVITFSIYIDTDYDQFTRDTRKKIMVLDKLKYLYGDSDLHHITVTNITRGSVVFSWTNNSLSTDRCQKEEVTRLKSVIIDENGNMTERFKKTFRLEFNISKVDAKPSAACQDAIKPTSVMATPDPTAETEHATSEDDVYLTTIIPAVVIAAMLIVAAIIACVLYRKKRKGKLNVEEQSAFLNKGIPIIFADELDEKADPAKSPVIMKEEKPPLPPPEYPRSSGSSSPATPPIDRKGRDNTLGSSSGNRRMDTDSGVGSSGGATGRPGPGMFPVPAQENSPLYQPPPPFTTNRDTRMNRPKHTSTPTYRMPPPYVPP